MRLGRLAAAAVLVSASVVACTAPPSAKPVYCGLAKATIVAGPTAPFIVNGTSRNDVIAVTGGVHEVFGGAGNDTICADAVGTTIYGGDGNDWLIGGAGKDHLDGGNGNDLLQGGGGSDTLIGGSGTDTVTYADHTAPVTAQPDGKPDSGSAGEDDTIDPSVENLIGGSGNDTLTGTSGANVLEGGAGNDRLLGGAGSDRLEGQAGNDDLMGMSGTDVKDGGTGTNYCDTDRTDGSAAACLYDPHTPTIQGITMLTPQINFRNAERALDFQVHGTDGGGGIWTMQASLCGPDGKPDGTDPIYLPQVSGTSSDGTWEGYEDLPDAAPTGTWTVCRIDLVGFPADFVSYVTSPAPGSSERPMPSGNSWIVNNDGTTDHLAPAISASSCTPSVNVSNADATVTCDFTVTEHGSGVHQLDVDVRDFNGALTQYSTVVTYPDWLDTGNPQLVTPDGSGVTGSGSYRATLVIPVGAAPGTWLVHIRAFDAAENQTTFNSSLNVVDTRPITDAPHLVDGMVTTPTSTTLTVSLHLQATRDETSHVNVQITDPSNTVGQRDLALASGTDTDGVWQATIPVPPNDTGSWSLDDVWVTDRFGITRQLAASDLAHVTGRTWTMS